MKSFGKGTLADKLVQAGLVDKAVVDAKRAAEQKEDDRIKKEASELYQKQREEAERKYQDQENRIAIIQEMYESCVSQDKLGYFKHLIWAFVIQKNKVLKVGMFDGETENDAHVYRHYCPILKYPIISLALAISIHQKYAKSDQFLYDLQGAVSDNNMSDPFNGAKLAMCSKESNLYISLPGLKLLEEWTFARLADNRYGWILKMIDKARKDEKGI